MLTAAKLAKRTRRRVHLSLWDFASAERLRPCWTPECSRCNACQRRAPLSGELWASLFARGRPADDDDRRRRMVSAAGGVSYALTPREQLAAELQELAERELVRLRVAAIDRGWALQRRWDREDIERADRELVAAVAARAAGGAAA